MPRPPKLTMAEAEKIAASADPAVWKCMSPAERHELVKAVNEHHAKAWAADDGLRRMFPKMGKRSP